MSRVYAYTRVSSDGQAENTSLTEWRRDDGADRWTLVRYNDFSHLL